MSKKDYILLARVLKESDEANESIYGCALRMAEALAKTNPRFNVQTFMEACKPSVPSYSNSRSKLMLRAFAELLDSVE